MLTYQIDGQILTLTAVGTSTDEQRAATFQDIRNDPKVPNGAFLLINARRTTEAFNQNVFYDRVQMMIRMLGPKLAPICAVIGPDSYIAETFLFQTVAGEAGLRVGVFHDESSARRWLSAYGPD